MYGRWGCNLHAYCIARIPTIIHGRAAQSAPGAFISVSTVIANASRIHYRQLNNTNPIVNAGLEALVAFPGYYYATKASQL